MKTMSRTILPLVTLPIKRPRQKEVKKRRIPWARQEIFRSTSSFLMPSVGSTLRTFSLPLSYLRYSSWYQVSTGGISPNLVVEINQEFSLQIYG